ncbi:DUF1127 domain-containing protein [Pseudooceanicola algae]|uniref:DUF1127 domain-containing protein n=1 Tax=Pseudooceanicola algae TaxID=1537215 RepID=A0A418SEV4_9RHOB|nr:DUF1127 domain-containing protein [Pseudooceanicola algae]QPM89049.1 hypothetical protein PSAL_002580 [Pseudooceanicola algae]
MATATHISSAPSFGSRFSALMNSIGTGLNNYMERRTRHDQITALNAKSDAELAKLGIRRDEIPAYVFRHLFYI